MFALAGLAAAAPSVRVVPLDVIGPNMLRVSSNLNRGQENVISSIMMSLEPAIDAAIQRALAAGSFSSFSSFGTTGPVKFTGANGNTNFEGSYEGSSFSSSFEGNSASGGVAGAGQVSTQELGNQGITIEVVNSDANRWNAGISGASLQNSGAAFQTGSQQNSGAAFQAGSQQNSGAAFQAGSQQNSGASFQQTGSVSGSKFSSAGVAGVVHHDNSAINSGAAMQTGSTGINQQSSGASFQTGSNQASQFSTGAIDVSNQENTQVNGVTHHMTAGVEGVVFHGTGASDEHSGNQGNQQTVAAVQNQAVNTKFTTVSSSQQTQIVEGVMAALVPSIEAAVQAALLSQQQSAVSTSTFSTGSQQSAGQVSGAQFVSGQVSGSQSSSEQTFGSQQSVTNTGSQQTVSSVSGSQQSVTSSQQISAAEEQALVLRIIEVLTPSITTAVRRALSARVETTQVTVNVPAVTQIMSTSSQQGANQQSAFGASQQSSFAATGSSQSSSSSSNVGLNQGAVSGQTSSSSSIDQNRLIAQIMAALRPSISLSVEQALEASRVTASQANFSNNQGFTSSNQVSSSSQGSSSGFTSGSSSGSSSGSISGSSSGSSLSSQTLSGLFGDGQIHSVSVETPLYQIKYDN